MKDESVKTNKLKRLFNNKIHVVIGLVLILLIVTFAGGFLKTKSKPQTYNQAKAEYEQTINKAADFESENKPNQAIGVWQDYVDKPPHKDFHFQGLLSLGNAYYNAKRYKEAFKIYEQARNLEGKDVISTTQAMALTAERMGDKKTAIIYYQKTISLMKGYKNSLPANDLNRFQADEDIGVYQKKIDELSK